MLGFEYIKLISLVYYQFFNVAARKLDIDCVTPIMFLLSSGALVALDWLPVSHSLLRLFSLSSLLAGIRVSSPVTTQSFHQRATLSSNVPILDFGSILYIFVLIYLESILLLALCKALASQLRFLLSRIFQSIMEGCTQN